MRDTFFPFSERAFILDCRRWCKSSEGVTGVSGFASHGEVDVALLGRLLHQLHHQLVRLAHHGRAIHAYELVAGPQASVLVRRAVLHDVADVYLKDKRRKCRSSETNRLHPLAERKGRTGTKFNGKLGDAYRLSFLVPSEDSEAKAGVFPPEEYILLLEVGNCKDPQVFRQRRQRTFFQKVSRPHFHTSLCRARRAARGTHPNRHQPPPKSFYLRLLSYMLLDWAQILKGSGFLWAVPSSAASRGGSPGRGCDGTGGAAFSLSPAAEDECEGESAWALRWLETLSWELF